MITPHIASRNRYEVPGGGTGGWEDDATCRMYSDEDIKRLWLAERVAAGESGKRHHDAAVRRAKAICVYDCPVRVACLDAAMRWEAGRGGQHRYYVYGGLDPDERAALARKQQRRKRA